MNPILEALLEFCRFDRTWVRGEGSWLYDSTGRRFLDMYGQYGAVALGHNAPEVVAAAREALDSSEPAMVQPYRAAYAEALAAALTRVSPGNLSRCVFTTSGAAAVEAAIKLARSRTGRPIILSAHRSFHGKTMGALAATGQPDYSEDFGPEPPGFERIPFGDASALDERFADDGHHIAALLLEPIQGEGGVHAAPPGYLQKARELCTQYGAALVVDEIQTGLGRTGRMFACEHEGIEPDVLLIAKALGGGLFPLGACLVSPELWDERFALRHSSTFANNNVACRVGLAVLAALEGGLCAEARRKGEILQSRLADIAERRSHVVRAVRGRGMLAAIELAPIGLDGSTFLSYLQHQGLYAYAVASAIGEEASVLVLPTLGGSNVLRIAPPLTISDEDLDMGLRSIEGVLSRLERGTTRFLAGALGAFDTGTTPARETVALPPPRRHKPTAPTYAFLVHLTRPEDVALTDPDLEGLSRDELNRYCAFVSRLPFGIVSRVAPFRSRTGDCAEGMILALPVLPSDMVRRGARRMKAHIQQGVELAARLGAGVVGLGGLTTPFSRRGLDVVGRGPTITTGNTLTSGMAFESTRLVAKREGLRLQDARVAVVGARGSVGALCARLFARAQVLELTLVGNAASSTSDLLRFQTELQREYGVSTRVSELSRIGHCDIVLTATGAARPILDHTELQRGAIVCDVARPPDTSPELRAARPDLHIIQGGLVHLPEEPSRIGSVNLQGLPEGIQLGCLAETMLLALAGERRDRGVGDFIAVDDVDATMALARRHGFTPALVVENASRKRATA